MAELGLLKTLLRRIRRRLILRQALLALSMGVMAHAVLLLLGLAQGRALALAAGLSLMAFAALTRRTLKHVDETAVARHLDRLYPELEESSALLATHAGDLTTLQSMQYQRVSHRAGKATADGAWLPSMKAGPPLAVMVVGLLLAWGAPAWLDRLSGDALEHPVSGAEEIPSDRVLKAVSVTISPPAYTGLPESRAEDLDLQLPAGSKVSWALEFSRSGGQFALAFSDGHLVNLEADSEGRFGGTTLIDVTGLYRVVELIGDAQRPLEGVYTIAAQLDRKPDVRILDPADTALEIPLEGPPRFSLESRISDDFGIAHVAILASVGRGGGEGVKFRDQSLEFTDREDTDQGSLFRRDWDLTELGMEPGDEVYFFVTAQDNREPEANQARSRTVVVRWLDEETAVAEFAGLAIDVMPDYFKSQRQIIIETEQLIADRDDLDSDTFDDLSRGLAQAQSDLKQRYGQYLGDEAEEGGAFEPPPEAQGNTDSDDDHDGHDDEHDDDHDEDSRDALAEIGHDHGAEAAAAADIDTSGGAQELIARFAHDHGASEIGPITARNPVGLMKRSLSNMWQAELHLHLSEPEKALPFEYEALKYFNLARQADRVYTRRLGFEPPPVSEERRLTGELDDILEYTRRNTAQPDPSDARLFRDAWRTLSTQASSNLSPERRELLESLRLRLTELSQQRPALIRQAATVERLLLAGRLELADCEGCVDGLMEALWSMLPDPESQPSPGSRSLDLDDDLAREFIEQVSQ